MNARKIGSVLVKDSIRNGNTFFVKEKKTILILLLTRGKREKRENRIKSECKKDKILN